MERDFDFTDTKIHEGIALLMTRRGDVYRVWLDAMNVPVIEVVSIGKGEWPGYAAG